MRPTIFFLLFLTSFVDSVIYQAKFRTVPIGTQFISNNPADLLNIANGTKTLFQCIQQCMNDIRCRTVSFDLFNHRCSLFSAWNFEGTFPPSSSSQVAFIDQNPTLYRSHQQSCIPSIDNLDRYLRCISNTWICPYRYFFNGAVCEAWRTFHQSCSNDQWCDQTKYLYCSIYMFRCRCNSSMSWNGSICVSVCPSGQMGISFDDLQAGNYVPQGYGGFRWSSLAVLISGGTKQWAYNVNASPMNISYINGTFTLATMKVPSMSVSYLNVTTDGLKNGILVYTGVHLLNNSYTWHLLCNITNIDVLSISTSPMQAAVMTIDDLCLSV